MHLTNAVHDSLEADPGTITFQAPNESGEFSGSFIIPGDGSGIVTGTLRGDGGISISEFGDPNLHPLSALAIIENVFWWCDFSRAGFQPMSGSVANRALTLHGAIILPCRYYDTQSDYEVTTTINLDIAGSR